MLRRFALSEERVLALAGVFQACALAGQTAREGRCDEVAMAAGIASVLRIDAPSVVGVYGHVGALRLGLRQLIAQLDGHGRDLALTRIATSVLRLERALARRPKMRDRLAGKLRGATIEVTEAGEVSSSSIQRLAAIYLSTLSRLRPRVMVPGDPKRLRQPEVADAVRANLLAAVRSAVLWRQLGGRPWQLVFQRRQCAMLARGLLTGATLDNGL